MDDKKRKELREIVEKIALDARHRWICVKPEYDTIDLGETLLVKFIERLDHEARDGR